MNSKVSIIITTRNRSSFLKIAIESVLEQIFNDFELIIIDDDSRDNTEKVVKSFGDNRIRYYKIKKAESIAQARNSAIKYIKGEYVAIIDSDDIWCDNRKLEKQVYFLDKNKDYVAVGSGAIIIDENGKEVRRVLKPENDKEIIENIILKNPILHSSVLYRTSSFKFFNGYNENIKYGEDLDLWIRFSRIAKLYNLQEYLIKYRIHKGNESSKHFFKAIFDVLNIIRNNKRLLGIKGNIFFKKAVLKLLEILKIR